MKLLAGALMLAFLGAAPVQAAAKGGETKTVENKADREKLRDQIFDQLRAERMWKLTDALKLDEATAAKLFPLLSKYDEQERNLGKERGETHRELRQIVESASPDTARLNALIDKLVGLRTRRHELEVSKLAALRKVLQPVQMAKMMMLTPRMDESFRRRIHDAIEGSDGDPAPSSGTAKRPTGGGHSPLVGQP